MAKRHIRTRRPSATRLSATRGCNAPCSPGATSRLDVARWLGAFGMVALFGGLAGQNAAGVAAPQRPGGGHEYRELTTTEGRLRYALLLPDDFDPSRTYPALLAFPPGPQTEPMVDAGFDRYWGPQASRRGWIVVSPAAPDGQIFHRGGDTLIPALLDQIASEFQIEGGRFHVAGWSNGGRTAFHVALQHPSRVRSLVVIPGGPPTENDADRLGQLEGIPVRMFAGGRDTEWVRVMQDTEQRLKALGVSVESTVLPGEGHVPPSLDGERIMTLLEGLRESGVG